MSSDKMTAQFVSNENVNPDVLLSESRFLLFISFHLVMFTFFLCSRLSNQGQIDFISASFSTFQDDRSRQ